MIRFDNGELEIALLTYKRAEFVKAWLDKCFQDISARNIKLSVYDSSPDDETEKLIQQYNQEHNAQIVYYRIDNEKIIIGYKTMAPILQSDAKYLWVCGDSRYQDFAELDKVVFPSIKNRVADYIVFNVINNMKLPDTLIEDLDELLYKAFVPSTCIGLSIYNLEMFKTFKQDKEMQERYDKLFRFNFGFGWLGYFYNVYATGKYKTLLVNVQNKSLLDLKKKQAWATKFYGCWCEDLCFVMDNIPDKYTNKDIIPANVWKVMKLDSLPSCLKARAYGDLDIEKYNKLIANGLLDRITKKKGRIKFFASLPKSFSKFLYDTYRRIYYFLRGIKHLVR